MASIVRSKFEDTDSLRSVQVKAQFSGPIEHPIERLIRKTPSITAPAH